MDKKLVFGLVFFGIIAFVGAFFWFFWVENEATTPAARTTIQGSGVTGGLAGESRKPSIHAGDITEITSQGALNIHSTVQSLVGIMAEKPVFKGFATEVPEQNNDFLDKNAPPLPDPDALSFASPKKQLTEADVFNRVWTSDYRNYVETIEKLMIQDGFVKGPSALNTDQDMYDSMERILNYALKKGWVAEKDSESLRKGIREVLPALIEEEKQGFLSGNEQTKALPKDQNLTLQKKSQKDAVSDLLDGLKYVFMASPAHASEDYTPSWNTSPDCYKDLNALNPVPGVNLWAFCCNCGLYCSYGCVFIYDCGPYSTSCNVPLGCLNLVCQSWPNAVWDAWWYFGSPPGNIPTGICGCG